MCKHSNFIKISKLAGTECLSFVFLLPFLSLCISLTLVAGRVQNWPARTCFFYLQWPKQLQKKPENPTKRFPLSFDVLVLPYKSWLKYTVSFSHIGQKFSHGGCTSLILIVVGIVTGRKLMPAEEQ